MRIGIARDLARRIGKIIEHLYEDSGEITPENLREALRTRSIGFESRVVFWVPAQLESLEEWSGWFLVDIVVDDILICFRKKPDPLELRLYQTYMHYTETLIAICICATDREPYRLFEYISESDFCRTIPRKR